MKGSDSYWVLAYYKFVELENPEEMMKAHHQFLEGRDVSGRIYLGKEGINGQFSGAREDAQAYMDWLKQDPCFSDIHFKVHSHHENVFPRMTIKIRDQLVAMDEKVDTSEGGEHVSPQKWKEMLESEEDYVLIDTRNDYEWEVGHFKGATLPDLNTFREFPKYARDLKDKVDPQKTKVMMYCTGGIRCELYSALMKREGFEEVYQLDGGVINYGLEMGNDLWEGKLFVFDDRISVPISDEEPSVIAKCWHCQKTCDDQYNCANMDCNELFVCCSECLETFNGCCCEECTKAERVRKPHEREGKKPFRRLHHYRKM